MLPPCPRFRLPRFGRSRTICQPKKVRPLTVCHNLHEPERHRDAPRGVTRVRWVCAAVWRSAFAGAAHTLPVSCLRLVPEADYLHLELAFNLFELSFVTEVDDNKGNELDPGELEAESDLRKPGATAAKR